MSMPAEVVNLNRIARQLLEAGTVEVVIGYGKGTLPLTAAPLFARNPQQADELIFDKTCENNLVTFLHRFRGRKVAVVVKGCDERSLVGLLQEKRFEREDIVVIGAPCTGVLHTRTVREKTGMETIAKGNCDGDAVTVTAADGTEASVPAEEVVYAGCKTCAVRNPRHADSLVGEPVHQPDLPDFTPEIAEVEALSSAERWEIFAREMDKCILCFACRNLCPACYCSECFAESSQPKWMGKTDEAADTMFFHLTRLLHLAGRCTGCGACQRGCPVNVNLRLYNDKLRKDAKEIFAFEAGLDPEAEAPMTCFRMDDKNDFIR